MADLVARFHVLMLAGLTVFGGNAALAQPLPDPTRPPNSVLSGTGAADVAGSEGQLVTGPVLQSVIIRPGSKPAALIGGEWVKLGGLYAGARVIKVTDSAVELRGPNGKETLYMNPVATKVPAANTKPGAKPVPKAGSEK